MHTTYTHATGSGSGSSSWTACDVEGCLGEVIPRELKCLRHADVDARNRYLHGLRPVDCLLLRGVNVDQGLLDTVLHCPAITDSNTKTVNVPISLAASEISARLEFDGYTFEKHIDFSGAILLDHIRFTNCRFDRGFHSRFAFFQKGALYFVECSFSDLVDLSYTAAKNTSVGYNRCKFTKPLNADGIEATLHLDHCACESDLTIRGANAGGLILTACSIERELDLQGTHFGGFSAPYLKAAAHQLGPFCVKGSCSFAHAQFSARIQMEVEADELDLSGLQLREGGHILVDRARVRLNHLSTGRSLHVVGRSAAPVQAAILGLQGADAGAMTFAHVDMSRCMFYGAHDLGKVTIEPTVRFARTPRPYSSRRCIADEFAWRQNADSARSSRWVLPGTRRAADPKSGNVASHTVELPELEASQVASVYHDLRRSFETKSDEPGAADFYYGEMEMRRHSKQIPFAEWVIVWAYWLVSGYGLRASRAFAWLVLLIVLGGIGLANWGFVSGPTDYLTGLLYSIRAPLPGVLRDIKLTADGEMIETAVRLLGPILFALALLAVRGRVKR